MNLRLPLLLLLCTSLSVHADKKSSKEVAQQILTPEPDELPVIPMPERPMSPLREVTLTPTKSPQHRANGLRGIDVSHYQGTIDWKRVAKDANATFVYIKATEGAGYVDKCYLRNLAGAQRAGIPVGVYHFFSPSASALIQLQNFKSNVNPLSQNLIPVVDVEKRGKKSLSVFQAQLRGFLDELEHMYGVPPIIYTGVNFYNKYLAGRFTRYRFMIARYADELPTLDDEDLDIVLWQFTSEGRISGITGNVDCSSFVDRHTIADILLPPRKKK